MILTVLAAIAQDKGGGGNKGPEGDHHVGYDSVAAGVIPGGRGMNLVNGPSVRQSSYVEGRLDRLVWDLESRVNQVREDWQFSDEQSEAARENIRHAALRYGRALGRVGDSRLGLGGLVVKYEYACFAFVMAAANTQSKGTQMATSREAEGSCRAAAAHLREAADLRSTDQSAAAVMQWAQASEELPRINYLLAMSKCLQAASGMGGAREQATQIVTTEIPGYYLDRYPPARDIVLKGCTGD